MNEDGEGGSLASDPGWCVQQKQDRTSGFSLALCTLREYPEKLPGPVRQYGEVCYFSAGLL